MSLFENIRKRPLLKRLSGQEDEEREISGVTEINGRVDSTGIYYDMKIYGEEGLLGEWERVRMITQVQKQRKPPIKIETMGISSDLFEFVFQKPVTLTRGRGNRQNVYIHT